MEKQNNNQVRLCGKIKSQPKYSHHIYGEGFYELELAIKRLSDIYDIIPVTISERLLSDCEFEVGDLLTIEGQFRSYNKYDGERSRLMLSVFAREILENEELNNPNNIEIIGYICKLPIYRTTPFKREICDVLVAVNRAYNKSDYIPCIAWGRNARYVNTLNVGDKINISGRIQSREYIKQLEDGEQVKVAYEVSINKIYELEEYESNVACSSIDDFYKCEDVNDNDC